MAKEVTYLTGSLSTTILDSLINFKFTFATTLLIIFKSRCLGNVDANFLLEKFSIFLFYLLSLFHDANGMIWRLTLYDVQSNEQLNRLLRRIIVAQAISHVSPVSRFAWKFVRMRPSVYRNMSLMEVQIFAFKRKIIIYHVPETFNKFIWFERHVYFYRSHLFVFNKFIVFFLN